MRLKQFSSLSFVLAAYLLSGSGGHVHAQSAANQQSPCSGAQFHLFDFWIGDWDVYDLKSGSKSAHVRVSPALNGCALREEYIGTDGNRGESMSAYDAALGGWRQIWISSHGQIVMLTGGMQAGAMVLKGSEGGTHAADLVRGFWTPEHGNVRETAERSSDDGKSWQPWFDLEFRPAPVAAQRPAR